MVASSPNWVFGYVPAPAEWNNLWAGKADASVFNVKAYGAIGDGSSHQAATRYNSLGALQGVYPFATALTNELDWCAWQAAINAAAALSNGGVVYGPAGQYVFSNASSVSDGSGQLILPPTVGPLGSPTCSGVSIKGDNQGTQLNWPTDLGTGKHAILCNANRTDPFFDYALPGFIDDITLIGPLGITTLGVPGALMMGIGTADRRHLRRLSISYFWAGIEVEGGQFEIKDIHIQGCYYGLYWQDPHDVATPGNSNIQFGNQFFTRVVVQGNGLAAIGVHHAASMSSCTFISCFLGVGPYGIFKETNSGSPANFDVMAYTKFTQCQFENIGNGLVSDDRSDMTTRVCILRTVEFEMCQFMWDHFSGNNFHLPATTTGKAVIDVAQAINTTINGFMNPEQWQPGSVAIFSVYQLLNVVIRGDIDQLINNCVNAVSPSVNNFATGGAFSWVYYDHVLETVGKWKGQVRFASTTVSVQDCVVETGDVAGSVARCAGTSSEVVAGVVMYALPSNNFMIVATSGPALVNTTGTITVAQRLQTSSTAGKVQTGGSGAVAGVATYNSSANVQGIIVRPT